jgi:hypothetical protein
MNVFIVSLPFRLLCVLRFNPKKRRGAKPSLQLWSYQGFSRFSEGLIEEVSAKIQAYEREESALGCAVSHLFWGVASIECQLSLQSIML